MFEKIQLKQPEIHQRNKARECNKTVSNLLLKTACNISAGFVFTGDNS